MLLTCPTVARQAPLTAAPLTLFPAPRLSDVCGEVEVLRTKKLPSSRLAAATLYQRYVWDSEAMQVLTDAPASDFIADQ